MPIGNPMSRDVPRDEHWNISTKEDILIPVSDIKRALDFYVTILRSKIIDNDPQNNTALLELSGSGRIKIFVPSDDHPLKKGRRTVSFLKTDSVYDLHKTLIDEGVEFTKKPERTKNGKLTAKFLDTDGNEFEVEDVPRR